MHIELGVHVHTVCQASVILMPAELYIATMYAVSEDDVFLDTNFLLQGAQWLRGRVLDSSPRAAGSCLTGVTALCP